MNEHPILFSASMVKAILEGRKTQTRRVVKGLGSKLGDEYCTELRNGEIVETATLCPYGKAGTRLWVRETWRLASVNASILNAQFWTVQFKDFAVLPHPQPARELFVPLAAKDTFTPGQTGIEFGKWRPSIFLPRWASRITLEVVSVRVERVQDISEEDAIAEGVETAMPATAGAVLPSNDMLRTNGYGVVMQSAKAEYAKLWDTINAKRGYGWDANPWVWVIEFKQVAS